MSKQYLSIACSNGNSGVFGFSEGTPQLRFDISNRGLLQAQELRFQGTLKVVHNSTGNPPAYNTNVNVDAMSGVQGVIQTLDISSRAYSSRALETIQNYPRLASAFTSALHSKSQYSSNLTHEEMAKGRGVDTYSERTDTNAQTPLKAVNQTLAQRKPLLETDGVEFNMRLMCGMFMSQDIDLEMLGGLTVEMTLAPDSNFLNGTGASDYHYKIENPRLVVPVLEKDQASQLALAQNPSPTMSFLSFTSLYNTLTSTDNQIVHRTNLRGVISSFQSYIPVSYINNFAQNGLGQHNPSIQKLTFHRGSARFPLEYSIQPPQDPSKNPSTQPTTNGQLLLNYLDAFRNFRDVKKSLVSKNTTDYANTSTGLGVFGTGVSYDPVSNAGVNATTDTLGFEIQSSLVNPSNPAGAPVPYAVYSYYLCKNVISVNAGTGITVVN